MENEQLLSELLHLSQKKEIPYTKKQLEKFSQEKLQQIYEEYKKSQLDDFNEAMVDVAIFKLDELMKKSKWIKEDSELGKKLQNKKLFRSDLKTAISYITPILPFIGFIEGAVTVATEVYDSYSAGEIINENTSPETETGTEYNKTPTDPPEDHESDQN